MTRPGECPCGLLRRDGQCPGGCDRIKAERLAAKARRAEQERCRIEAERAVITDAERTRMVDRMATMDPLTARRREFSREVRKRIGRKHGKGA